MNVLENPSRDPAFNLAAEEVLFSSRTAGDWLMLWVNDPAVVIGKFQNPWAEVSLNACESRALPILRRNSGGGAVYHDPGNLNYTILTDESGEFGYERFLAPVVRALRKLGVPAKISGSSAIEADGKKLSGNAQLTSGGRTLHHGTLLFDADLTVLGQITGHARENVVSKAIPSNPAPVGSIRSFLRDGCPLSDFAAFLREELAGADAPSVSFTAEEVASIAALAEEKYRSWEWNYGRTAPFEVHTPLGCFSVRHGIIEGCSLKAERKNALLGQRFMPETIRRILGEEAVRELFDSPNSGDRNENSD